MTNWPDDHDKFSWDDAVIGLCLSFVPILVVILIIAKGCAR